MEAAEHIRQAVSTVAQLRVESSASPALFHAVNQVKKFQAQRFQSTYADLLRSSTFGPAAHFFLAELYSDKDFAQRDVQFGRIAGALQTLFPQQVVKTAVSLAQLHKLTEQLDHAMGYALLANRFSGDPHVDYARAWNTVGRRHDRELQLETVLTVGAELERLTRHLGLRMTLRMMRGPAKAAGLGALQGFLEAGFDTFARMSGKGRHASEFLATIQTRETTLIASLFNIDIKVNEQAITQRVQAACRPPMA